MLLNLHPTLAAYVAASNAFDPEGVAACFHPDATVADEGSTHQGTEAIRAWAAETQSAYAALMEPTAVVEEEGQTVVTCQVTGNFPGSPIPLRFCFALDGGRIAALSIRE